MALYSKAGEDRIQFHVLSVLTIAVISETDGAETKGNRMILV
jgi:hypothetical protein